MTYECNASEVRMENQPENADHSLSLKLLQDALSDLEQKCLTYVEQIEELTRCLAATREEKAIIEKLITLRKEGATSAIELSRSGHRAIEAQGGHFQSGHPIMELVVDVLVQAQGPIHISELMRLLKEKNALIPGAGTQANLISYL